MRSAYAKEKREVIQNEILSEKYAAIIEKMNRIRDASILKQQQLDKRKRIAIQN